MYEVICVTKKKIKPFNSERKHRTVRVQKKGVDLDA